MLKLRHTIARVNNESEMDNQTRKFTSNVSLMNWNLFLYIVTILPFLFTFLVAYYTKDNDTSDPYGSR